MISAINSSKELIKNRMLKHALNYWSIKNADDLDPVVKLMMEALSTELYNVSNEIKDTEVRILEKISNLLAPEFLTCPNTAHALFFAPPVEPVETVTKTTHFFTSRKISSKGDDNLDTNIDVFFTPVAEVKLFDAKIACLATNNNLFLYDDNYNKMLAASNSRRIYNEPNTLWLGIDNNEKINSINNLSFCFEWKNPDPKLSQINYQLLPLGKWSVNNNELKTRKGLKYESNGNHQPDEERNIFIDYNLLSLLESDIRHFYDDRFITIYDDRFDSINELKENYPDELRKFFTEADLKKLNKKLLWIRIVFPVSLPQEALNEVQVHLNCFPVMNRQLNDLKYRLRGGSNIIPVNTTGVEKFLAMRSVSDEAHQYQSIPYRKTDEEIVGTYTIRAGGVERFDARNAKEYISYLLELLRSESSAFSVYGYEFIASILREMNQRIALMEQKTKGLAVTSTEIPHYIIARPFEGYEMMYAEFWTTQAEGANNIRSGTKFQQFQTSKFKASGLFLLTTTTGGKNRLKPEERLNAFRYGLITRNRIVTKEDVRSFCYYELGSRVQEVMITRGVQMSANPQHGFTRTIDIHLTPAATENLDPDEWNQLCDQLRSKLTLRSGMSNHYRILLQN